MDVPQEVMTAEKSLSEGLREVHSRMYRAHLRVLQHEAFKCSADCTAADGSEADAHRCLERCHTKLQDTQQRIAREMQTFQGKLQQCAAGCEESVRDKFEQMKDTSDTDVQGFMSKCYVRCFAKLEKDLPSLEKKLMNCFK